MLAVHFTLVFDRDDPKTAAMLALEAIRGFDRELAFALDCRAGRAQLLAIARAWARRRGRQWDRADLERSGALEPNDPRPTKYDELAELFQWAGIGERTARSIRRDWERLTRRVAE